MQSSHLCDKGDAELCSNLQIQNLSKYKSKIRKVKVNVCLSSLKKVFRSNLICASSYS